MDLLVEAARRANEALSFALTAFGADIDARNAVREWGHALCVWEIPGQGPFQTAGKCDR